MVPLLSFPFYARTSLAFGPVPVDTALIPLETDEGCILRRFQGGAVLSCGPPAL